MSHKASCWLAELPPEALNNGSFRVLFHLCDAHNSTRVPEEACFPNQATLRRVTGLSNGGLNNALNTIEKAGLIRRIKGTAPETKERRTYYILGCDVDLSTIQTPENGVRESSSGVEFENEQTPLLGATNSTFGANKLQWSGDYPVKEPVKDPVITPPPPKNGEIFTFREQLLEAMGHNPSGITASGKILGRENDMFEAGRWSSDLELSQAEILAVVRDVVTGRRDPPPISFKYFTPAMQRFAAQKNQPPLEPTTGVRHDSSKSYTPTDAIALALRTQ
ncbi:MAG: MarR family transcriptional regulator [Planktomarina sp.]